MYNWIAFLVLALAALAYPVAGGGRIPRWYPRNLLLLAIALRILGSTVRYEVLYRFYNGVGDAVMYFKEGREIAELVWSLQVFPWSPDFWMSGLGQWWGTSFLVRLSGVILSLIGPSIRGEFLLFSLLAFAGLYAIATAFHKVQPGPQAVRYARWMWLWPSLWFWPSSVGKEAITTLAIGLVTLAYVGRDGHIRWPLCLGGVGLAFCIRPHVAMVLAFSVLAAHWLGSWQRITLRRVVEMGVAVPLTVLVFFAMRGQFGIATADLEGIREFVEYRSNQTLQGGSNIGAVPLAASGVPLAFINSWMRPFPWEAHNLTSLIAGAEIVLLWWLVWRRRKALRIALKYWRQHSLLRFAAPLLLSYTLMIGLTFGNLGIIARQRAPVFPFLLMFALAVPTRTWQPRRVPLPNDARPLPPRAAT